MAQTNDDDFKEFFFRRVELQFPRLKDTYRFNNAEKRSEQCAQNANGAAWSVGVKLSKADAKDFHAQMKAHYEACRERNKKLPEFSKVFGMKKIDAEGKIIRDDDKKTEFVGVIFEAKKRGVTEAGKANRPPNVVDAALQPMTGDKLDIWSGSVGTVKVRAFPTLDPDGLGGISLLLETVQVIKPKYGSANLDGFEAEEVAEDEPAADPFKAAAERKASKPAVVEEEF